MGRLVGLEGGVGEWAGGWGWRVELVGGQVGRVGGWGLWVGLSRWGARWWGRELIGTVKWL